ncbi:MAG: FKBP-type peptidyl-prolyl cis-trans isomerase [Ginsengibacter sp.]
MKQLFVLSFILLLFLGSCKKNATPSCSYPPSTVVAPQAEQQAIHDSLTAHGLNATLAPSGFYYTINNPGAGLSPTSLCSTVAVFYRGGFFNGKGFDSTATGAPAVFQLGQVIAGWQKALPLIAKSGDMTLYIPPSLGYGTQAKTDSAGNVLIPANSNLVFRVIMADVQ